MTDYYVLHSGGLDSTVALQMAVGLNDARNIYSIGVDYGQRHITELIAAQRITDALNIPRMMIDLTGYGQSVKSALTDPNIAVPSEDYNADNMADTVVPGRNAVMLAAIAGFAASNSGDHPATVVIAVHGGDHHIYPDCRPEFITAQDHALKLATGAGVWAPFVNMTKADITAVGAESGAPLHLTWSCYNGGETHCGVCATCRERKAAFEHAGVEDPTEYLE